VGREDDSGATATTATTTGRCSVVLCILSTGARAGGTVTAIGPRIRIRAT
jgi:hypothetical protein